MTEDPWKDLQPSSKADLLSAKRVDATLPFGFFWAKGADHRFLLLLRHRSEVSPRVRLPRLHGIEVSLSEPDAEGNCVVAFRLLESGQRGIFYRLCMDIVESTKAAGTEQEAIALALSRTWRWHHLLRGGGDGRLGLDEQKGLIGELFVLERLLQQLQPSDAVQSWRGPLGAPKDFEIGQLAIEAKARRGAAVPHVAISSEHQLDTSGVGALLLFVSDLSTAPLESPDGRTLTEIARRIFESIAARDQSAAGLMESLLLAAGFRWQDDYSDTKWLSGSERVYDVAHGFPALTPTSCPPGVVNVRYSVSLPDCERFLISDSAVSAFISGGSCAR